jgi:hypothetical protein
MKANQNIQTCGICFRSIKTKNDKIVDHGFKMRGGRMGNCRGSRNLSFEITKKPAQIYLSELRNTKIRNEAEYINTRVTYGYADKNGVNIQSARPNITRRQGNEISEAGSILNHNRYKTSLILNKLKNYKTGRA